MSSPKPMVTQKEEQKKREKVNHAVPRWLGFVNVRGHLEAVKTNMEYVDS